MATELFRNYSWNLIGNIDGRSEKNKNYFIRSIQDFYDINQTFYCNLLNGIDNKTVRKLLLKLSWVGLLMGDDISSGLSSMAVCFDFRSTNVAQLSKVVIL